MTATVAQMLHLQAETHTGVEPNGNSQQEKNWDWSLDSRSFKKFA